MSSARPNSKPKLRGAAAAPLQAKKRLPPEERKQHILEGAVQYFAEVGFDGQTRELSSRLGITNALLFRYFPTKEDLIEQVYQHVYVQRWRPEWEPMLKDRSRALKDRLNDYYRSYLSVAYTYEWVRIFFYASLRGIGMKDRYLRVVENSVILPICAEVRHECGLPPPSEVPVTRTERDAAWGLHGGVLYLCIRRFIYNQSIEDPAAIMETAVELFLSGIKSIAAAAIADQRPAVKRRSSLPR